MTYRIPGGGEVAADVDSFLSTFDGDNQTVDLVDVEALDCSKARLPSTQQYYAEPNAAIIACIAVCSLSIVAVCATYVSTMRYITRNTPLRVRGYTVFVVSLYPVSAAITYLAVLVPRAHFLVQVVMNGMCVVCLYQMFCLMVTYLGGEEALSSRLTSAAIHPVTGPCCCFPCCRLVCKPVPVTRHSIRRLRILVLQLPLVQWILYIISFVIVAENKDIYLEIFPYLQPLFIGSMLLAVWGTNMTIRVFNSILSDFKATAKFMALQLSVILDVLQTLIAKLIANNVACTAPLTPIMWANLIVSTMLLVEMVPLSLWARSLYCRETPQLVALVNRVPEHPLRAAFGEVHNNNGYAAPVRSCVILTEELPPVRMVSHGVDMDGVATSSTA